jgi:hypothetical protein
MHKLGANHQNTENMQKGSVNVSGHHLRANTVANDGGGGVVSSFFLSRDNYCGLDVTRDW